MSCFDNRYVGLRPAGGLSQDHINKLKEWGVTNKPVFRAKCPPGYTHCAAPFDQSRPEQVANQGLWFVDEHGHVCMPNCGWGSQPDLRIKDRIAQMYRSGEIDKSKADAEKIRQAASSLLCDPCTPGKGSVSRASCALTTTLRELEETDKLVDSNKLLGGKYGRSASADGMMLGGGARLSPKAKCELEAMVRGVTDKAALKAECEEITRKYREKVAKKHEFMVRCKAAKYEDVLSDAEFEEVKNAIPTHVATALRCAEYNGLNNLPANCSKTSCFSGRAEVNDVLQKQAEIEMGKVLKKTYHQLMDVYSHIRRKVRQCCPMALPDKMKAQCKVQQIFLKTFEQAAHLVQKYNFSMPGNPFTTGAGMNLEGRMQKTRESAETLMKQMLECAALCAKDATGCTTSSGNCVPSMYCSSGMCVPEALEEMRKMWKAYEKKKAANQAYINAMKQVVSQHRRLSLV